MTTRVHADPAQPQEERVRTVLLVDDDADMLQSLKMLIQAELGPVHVLTTQSPEMALRILGQAKVDALVADYLMPGLNGLDLILRTHRVRPDLPAFLVTGYGNLPLATVAINKAHVEGFFPKPLDEYNFRESLRRALRGRA